MNGYIKDIKAGNTPKVGQHFKSHHITFLHEIVHFWQSLTTYYVYEKSMLYAGIYSGLMAGMHEGKKTFELRAHEYNYKEKLENIGKSLISSTQSSDVIAPLDIIEGHAVYNSFCLAYNESNHENFIIHLECYGSQREYVIAYLFATHLLGESAFFVFPALCYLALQTSNPGKLFCSILLQLSKISYKIKDTQHDPLHFISENFKLDSSKFFVNQIGSQGVKIYENDNNEINHHLFLKPYLERIAKLRSEYSNLAFFLSCPTYYLKKYNSDQHYEILFKKLFPPIISYNKQEVAFFSEGSKLFLEGMYQTYLLTFLACQGVIDKILFGINLPNRCPKKNCNLYKKNICGTAPFFPKGENDDCLLYCYLNKLTINFFNS
jgi:hypothetical protein